MRIIAGYLGGRTFIAPSGHKTHPMSDKIRGALFNSLGDIKGLTVLDAFAGTGALSFEALSRGAQRAQLIESDRLAQRAILTSVKSLGLYYHLKLTKATIQAWLTTDIQLFDIVLCDPPYDDVRQALLIKIAQKARINGLVVMSLPPDISLAMPPHYELLQVKNYNDATLHFYRRSSEI